MFIYKYSKKIIWLTLFLLISNSQLLAQAGGYFGQNKVIYKKFAWKVFQTRHFNVHLSGRTGGGIQNRPDVGERWYFNDKLLAVEKLNSTFDIRVYRLGQSLWHYIGETFGKKMVGHLLKKAATTGNTNLAMKRFLKMEPKQLTKAWHDYARKLVNSDNSVLAQPDQIAEKITRQESFYHRMNIVPSVSPDGRQIVYIANKDLNEDIFLLSEDEQGNYKEERLIKGGESKSFETLRFFDTSIGWSRKGDRIAFVSKSGKDDALYIMEPSTKQIKQKFSFERLNAVFSPGFSPDGRSVTFAGLSNGVSDLYRLDLTSGILKRLTHDNYTVLHPQWSPTGKSIVFVTDRGTGSDEKNLLFGDYDLALYHLADHRIEVLTGLPGNVSSPQWSPNGQEIAFISDHQGIPNIYKIQLKNKEITRRINFCFNSRYFFQSLNQLTHIPVNYCGETVNTTLLLLNALNTPKPF